MTPFATIPTRLGPIRIHRLQTRDGYALNCPACSTVYQIHSNALSVTAAGHISLDRMLHCLNAHCGWRGSIRHGVVHSIDETALGTVSVRVGRMGATRSRAPLQKASISVTSLILELGR